MKTSLRIEGMHCQSCATLLTEALSGVQGVQSAHVDFKTGTATIEHKTKEATLRKTIEAQGYKAR
jgi:copper chaperone CopZ